MQLLPAESSFTIDRIMECALIQSPPDIEFGIEQILKSYPSMRRLGIEATVEQVWVAYERCGYDASLISEYLLNGFGTKQFKHRIQKDDFSNWSGAKKMSFRNMYVNLNAFFYRHRPLGENPRHGKIEGEEADQLQKRYLFFREVLGINENLWGYFAVPFRGRVGYQCANFLTETDNNFKDIELTEAERKKFQGGDPMQFLVKEALACLYKYAGDEFNDALLTRHAIFVLSHTTMIRRQKKVSSDIQESPRRLRLLKPEKPMRTVLMKQPERQRKTMASRIRQSVLPPKGKAQKRLAPQKEKFNLALGARDQITGAPMKAPLINPDGYIFDATTWDAIYKGEVICPYPITWFNKSDLTELTEDNFDSFRPVFKNIYV